jgi:hypothetical protein
MPGARKAVIGHPPRGRYGALLRFRFGLAPMGHSASSSPAALADGFLNAFAAFGLGRSCQRKSVSEAELGGLGPIAFRARRQAPGTEWQREVQTNHACGDARSQSLACDVQVHTFVWAQATMAAFASSRFLGEEALSFAAAARAGQSVMVPASASPRRPPFSVSASISGHAGPRPGKRATALTETGLRS